MQRRRMLATIMWLGAHAINVGLGLFSWSKAPRQPNACSRFSEPPRESTVTNRPTSPPPPKRRVSERPTESTAAKTNRGLIFLCGTGFVVVCGNPDETMLFVDLNEAAKHWRRTGGTTIVTTTLGVVRIEATTRLQAAALSDAIKSYNGPKRFRWMPNVVAGNGELFDLHGFWRDAT